MGTATELTTDAGQRCPWLPSRKLFPVLGAFAGPVPGPCIQFEGTLQYEYAYDAHGQVLSRTGPANEHTSYFWTQGLLVREEQESGESSAITNYEYASNSVRLTKTTSHGLSSAYTYALNDEGYVTDAMLVNPTNSSSVPVRYEYLYVGCQLRYRIAYDSNGKLNLTATAEYSYNDQGQLIQRKSEERESRFGYSCW